MSVTITLKETFSNLKNKFWEFIGVLIFSKVLFTIMSFLFGLIILGNYFLVKKTGIMAIALISHPLLVFVWINVLILLLYGIFIEVQNLYLKKSLISSDMLDGFKDKKWNILKTTYLAIVKVIGGLILFVTSIGGIVHIWLLAEYVGPLLLTRIFQYPFAYFVIHDNPDLSPSEVLEKCKELTKDNIWQIATVSLPWWALLYFSNWSVIVLIIYIVCLQVMYQSLKQQAISAVANE